MARLAANGMSYSEAWGFAVEDAPAWVSAYREARHDELAAVHDDLADRIAARLRPGGRE